MGWIGQEWRAALRELSDRPASLAFGQTGDVERGEDDRVWASVKSCLRWHCLCEMIGADHVRVALVASDVQSHRGYDDALGAQPETPNRGEVLNRQPGSPRPRHC